MFGLGVVEMTLILGIGFMLFGPALVKRVIRGAADIRKEARKVMGEFKDEVDPPDEPKPLIKEVKK